MVLDLTKHRAQLYCGVLSPHRAGTRPQSFSEINTHLVVGGQLMVACLPTVPSGDNLTSMSRYPAAPTRV